ncbi:helix-turn-helix transcriptional regulator [Amycolatopsis sp. NPDC005232]|uniref:helix-turn-helix transcriptional regulator n=1 Tax=Amycolatopsis sp. NPDC005232 TaxID=3157027 RepID=UPI0033B0D943
MEPDTIGELLRHLRAQSGRSQAEQADTLSTLSGRPVTRNEVSRWEAERRLLTPFWQQHFADSFDVDGRLLRDAVVTSRTARRRAKGDEGAVHRREFIGAMASLALPLSLAQPPTDLRIGQADIDRLRRRTARLRRLDDVLGGGDTAPVYAAEVTTTQDLLNRGSYTGDIGRELHVLLAEQLQQAGWAAFDHGDHRQASRFYDDSRRVAEQAGARALAGNALAYAAYQQTTTAKDGTADADASYEVAREAATPKVSALLLSRKAWAHAVAGDARQADTALAMARDALHRSDDRPEPDWVFWVDGAEVDIMAGRCWTELRRPLRAVPVLERVLGDFDDTCARDKALYLTWLATSYLQAHEVEHSAATLRRAHELAVGVASTRPGARIAAVARKLDRHRDVSEVAQVLDEIRA